MEAVREVLEEIGAGAVPELLVFNKADRLNVHGQAGAHRLAERYEGAVAVSAHSGENVEYLMAVIGDRVRSMTELAELLVPWARGDVIASIHREGQVLSEAAEEEGMRLKARLEPASLGALRDYLTDPIQAAAVGGNDDRDPEDW